MLRDLTGASGRLSRPLISAIAASVEHRQVHRGAGEGVWPKVRRAVPAPEKVAFATVLDALKVAICLAQQAEISFNNITGGQRRTADGERRVKMLRKLSEARQCLACKHQCGLVGNQLLPLANFKAGGLPGRTFRMIADLLGYTEKSVSCAHPALHRHRFRFNSAMSDCIL